MFKRNSFATLISVSVLLALGTPCISAEEPAQPEKETVVVDLARDKGPVTYRASGFLHAMSATVPSEDMVAPLKPQLFRMCAEDWHHIGAGAFANYERATKLGARMQVVVSDSHGYGLANWWPGDNGDWGPWEMLVESLVKRAQAAKCTFEWDIWNEPDHKYFWAKDRDTLFETYRRAVVKIRSIEPKAVIVGPSIAGYSTEYLEAFLLYAKANNVLPEVLSWHEFSGAKRIAEHCAEMRLFMSRNGIDIKRICINEMLNGGQQNKPGITVQFLANADRAGVDGACHACWNDKDQGVSGCENQSLDGLLTHPDKKPRSSWWAYKAYAGMTGRLVEMEPTKTIDGLAGKDEKSKTAMLLLGRNSKTPGEVTIEVTNLDKASFLVKNGKVRVLARKIPPSEWEHLPGLETTLETDIKVENNKIKITLPAFGEADAYVVSLGKFRK